MCGHRRFFYLGQNAIAGFALSAAFIGFALSATGCGSADQRPSPPVVDPSAYTNAACPIDLAAPASEGANHTARACLPVTWASNPPASGTHYGSWPVFRAYDQPVPWGFLLHGMEHGAVVLAYNCPDGCAADVAAAKEVMAAVPHRPKCARAPVILTPDPGLSSRFAAAAWGHVMRASCFDRRAFATFIAQHANQGPEYFPEDCGVVDFEAQGWCP